MSDPSILTETGIDNLRFFVKFLSKHNLFDDVHERLKDKGINKLQISLEVVKEIQDLIQEKADAKGGAARDEQAVIASAHNNNF